jgi:predicted permease
VDRVLLVSADLLGRGYTRPAARDFVRDALERLQQLPGVESAAAASVVPLDVRGMPHAAVEIDGRSGRENAASILSYTISPGYLATMGLRLVAGEDLAPFGRDNRPADAIVNEEMARRFWPGISPLGHRFKFAGDKDEDAFEVVGIAANTKYESLAETPQPIAWITARHDTMLAPAFHVRVRSGDPAALLPAVREALHALDPEVSVYDGRTFAQHVDNNLFLQRTPAQMLAILAPLALALAAIGIYAVLAYAVAQRTAEIGVRLTLGATPAGVMRLVVGEGMRVVGLGAAAGWLLALGAGWFLQRRLVGVPLGDPLVYLGVPALLLAVAALACWIPARRAARVDPMTALRAE